MAFNKKLIILCKEVIIIEPSLFFGVVGLIVLFLVIKFAIDSSETAQNIRDIRNKLYELHPNKVDDDMDEYDLSLDGEEIDIHEIPYDKCPKCQVVISENDEICPSCRMKLH